MGSDKAFLELAGQTLLNRALAALRGACGSVTIVGDPAIFANYAPTVADVFAGCGPLAGIHSALTHSSAELNLMLAVDLPLVSTELLSFLFAAAQTNHATVTVPRTARGWQPLCAVYRCAFLPVAELALRDGKYKIDAAFSAVSTHAITTAELVAAGFSEHSFFNVNTPQDLLAAGSQ